MNNKIYFFEVRETEKNSLLNDNFVLFDSTINNVLKNISKIEKEKIEIISPFINSSITKDVLNELPNLKLIATRSTGVNHIDIKECEKRNITVKNVPSYGATTVAQYTFGLILCLTRNIMKACEDVKSQNADNEKYLGRDLNKLTLGVVGTGQIGTGVCKLAHAFGMKILAYDLFEKKDLKINYVPLETLIKNSDIITLHVPYKRENYHIFSKNEFNQMKNTAFLINTSRGELVDVFALYEAIIENRIRGCALDVIECEKINFNSDFFLKTIGETSKKCIKQAFIAQKMAELPNVIITPHIAYNTSDAILEILKITMDNIKDFNNK